MARHYNPSIAERIQRIFSFKAGDTLDNNVTGIVGVIPITPISREQFASSVSASSSTNTVKALVDGKDFYITGVWASYVKDATCDAGDGTFSVRATIDGSMKDLFAFTLLTLTAQSDSVFIPLEKPIKVDRGGTLQISQPTFTAGKFRRSVTYVGYYEEVTQS